ncbi:MAG: 4Fe-4S dicluster domain-containing protein, partial [Acidobacteriota bacterium]
SFCYQCGACVGDCPAATYDERFNPREIMLKVLYGLGEELIGEDSLLWQCTNCYNCYERCPQQVEPVEVIIALKNMMADRGIYPAVVKKIIETFEETGRTVPDNPAINKQRARFGLEPMAPVPMDEIRAIIEPAGTETPLVVARSKEDHHVRVEEPSASEAQAGQTIAEKMAFFPGCLIPARYPGMEFAIRGSIATLGIELIDLEGASCCPDPIYFKSKDKVAWLSVAARNLTLAEDLGVDVITNCSGCTATLSEAYHLLEDAALRERVNRRLAKIGREYRGTTRVRHLATVMRDVVGADAIRESVVRPLEGLKVALHYGCHLLKPSNVMNVDDPNNPQMLEELVSALGARTVRHRNWSLCCGKASQGPEVPDPMMRDLLDSVHDEQAEILCLICPTCFGQFDHGQARIAKRYEEDFHTPSVYYVQLLAFAQGVPYDDLGFARQRFKPECLRRFEEDSAC